MATADHLPFLSPAEYLEIERAAAEKSEYYDGRMHAMAGGTANHSLLGQSAGGEIRFALRGKGYRTFNSDMRIHIPATGLYTYADAAVACGKPLYLDATNETLMNPTLLVEVLSPTTSDYDRGRKFAQYRTIPSFCEYLTVAQDRVFVEQWTLLNAHWTLTEHATVDCLITLSSLGVTISVSEMYRGIDLPQGT